MQCYRKGPQNTFAGLKCSLQCKSAQLTPYEMVARETKCKTNNPSARPREPSGDHRHRDGAGHVGLLEKSRGVPKAFKENLQPGEVFYLFPRLAHL